MLSDTVCLLFLVWMETKKHAWPPAFPYALLPLRSCLRIRSVCKVLWFLLYCYHYTAAVWFSFFLVFFHSSFSIAVRHPIIEQVALFSDTYQDSLSESRSEFRRYLQCLLYFLTNPNFVHYSKVNDNIRFQIWYLIWELLSQWVEFGIKIMSSGGSLKTFSLTLA